MIIGLILVVIFLLSSVSIGTCGKTKIIKETSENNQIGIYFVYAGGRSTLMGCSAGAHISPFWLQTRSNWVSYGFDGPTVLIVNGIPMFYTEPVRIYMEGFKGIAPGSLHWGMKSITGTRIRLIGICTYMEVH